MKRASSGRALVRLCLVLALAAVAVSAAAQNIIIEPPDPVVCPDGRQCTASQLCQRVAGTSSYTCIAAAGAESVTDGNDHGRQQAAHGDPGAMRMG
jgi:hypothetical protein